MDKAELLKLLFPYYRDHAAMRDLWKQREKFSLVFRHALHLEYLNPITSLDEYARFFLDFTAATLIASVDDLVDVASLVEGDERSSFMSFFVENRLVSDQIIFDLLDAPDKVDEIGLADEWIDYPVRLRAGKIIFAAEPESISTDQLIPRGVGVDDFLKQYLLSWAYEEGKLSSEGIDFFRLNFRRKFDSLTAIKKRDGNQAG